MQMIWAAEALTPAGWAKDVRIAIDDGGRIQEIAAERPPEGERVDLLLPAPANTHSHSFQRAMAGLTERRGSDAADSFWTWRRLMYAFLEQLTPDDVEAIASLVQMEMLEAGFAAVGEFHYLHHQPDGRRYDDLAEMSARIAAAAARTGIGLTLLPVLYQHGGCDRRPLAGGQRRFGNDLDGFARLVDSATAAVRDLPGDARIGIAPHSLRAVAPETLGQAGALSPDGPVHMHIAEQQAEVDEVQAAWGRSPVDWLLNTTDLGPDWSLIHCTHMTQDECTRLAATGAAAVVCPITEASLGDGVFMAPEWLGAGGSIAIGSDSNVQIDLASELRLLEYGQRLTRHGRAIVATDAQSAGRRLFELAASGGAQALGRTSGAIAVGSFADLVALRTDGLTFAGRQGDSMLDSFVFAGDASLVSDVWASGRHVVREGRHVARDDIVARCRPVLTRLAAAQ